MSSLMRVVVGLALSSLACGGSVDSERGAAGSGGQSVGGTGGIGATNIGGTGNGGSSGGNGGSGGQAGAGGATAASCAAPDAPWQFFPVPSKQLSFVPYRELWGRALDDVWMIGDAELEHYHFDGSSWTASPGPGVQGFYPAAITGDGPNETYVANTQGEVFLCGASSCKPVTQPGNTLALTDLWSPAPQRLIAVNASGSVRFWNGAEWTTFGVNPPNSFAGASFSAIHGVGGTDVFAVTHDLGYAAWHFAPNEGDDGAFLPTPIATSGVTGLKDVWAHGPGRAIAIGEAGSAPPVLVALTPSSATVIPIVLPSPFDFVLQPRAVWASSENDVYAIVQSSDNQGYDDSLVVHWSGSAWTIIESLAHEMQNYSQNLDIWGFDAKHVFVASSEGVWRCAI